MHREQLPKNAADTHVWCRTSVTCPLYWKLVTQTRVDIVSICPAVTCYHDFKQTSFIQGVQQKTEHV